MGDNENYSDNFNYFLSLSSDIAADYLKMIYLDSVCYNMDRHTNNYGLIRNMNTGQISSLAPNFDNNIALIANGYPKDVSREKDGLIKFFFEFIDNNQPAKAMLKSLNIPCVTKDMIEFCLNKIPIGVDNEFIIRFILNGQRIIRDYIV